MPWSRELVLSFYNKLFLVVFSYLGWKSFYWIDSAFIDPLGRFPLGNSGSREEYNKLE